MTRVFLLLLLFVFQVDVPVAITPLDPGWNTLMTGDDTLCARGTPYQFFVCPAPTQETSNLMIYFQGGGACWNRFTCREGSTSFDDSVGTADEEFGDYEGLFDFTREDNPIIDYNVVFIPYCTGDIHTGSSVVQYQDDLEIHHQGYANTSAVLAWVFDNFKQTESVIIAGSSFGASGALYYTPNIADTYPNASIVQVGDSGVGVTPPGWKALELWGFYDHLPDFVLPDRSTFTVQLLYEALARQYPKVTFAQYTGDEDYTQSLSYDYIRFESGQVFAPSWNSSVEALFAGLSTTFPNFRVLTAEGSLHTILPRPEFYTNSVDEVRVADWFATLISS